MTEREAYIAEWNGDKLTITMAHQCPYDMRESTAYILDMPENRVRLIIPMMSGAFGMLLSFHRYWCIAAYLSRKAGKPVIYKMTLEEVLDLVMIYIFMSFFLQQMMIGK